MNHESPLLLEAVRQFAKYDIRALPYPNRCLIQVPIPTGIRPSASWQHWGTRGRQSRGDSLADPTPVLGTVRKADYPFGLVQIDHSKVDIILVDPTDRLPIGRPWITVAIDVATRMIAGFHIGLDAPGATSVDLCLVHVAMDKAAWLSAVGLEARLPLATH